MTASHTPGSVANERFAGIPAGARATAVPSVFFTELLPRIDDANELRLTLYVIYALDRRKGYPRFVTLRELGAEGPLVASLEDRGLEDEAAVLGQALAAAVERGSLLRVEIERGGKQETLVFLNSPADRRAVALIEQGRLSLGRPLPPEKQAPAPQRHNVFHLYEANIGALTPLVAEELKEAEQLYPYEWLEEAMREAALLNKRSWRYVAAILQRWATEGRKREEAGRDPGAGNTARAQLIRRYRELSGGD